MARQEPALALRLIRETRERGVRTWTGETSAERLAAVGTAFLGLERSPQGKEQIQCRTGTSGNTACSRCTARSAIRRRARCKKDKDRDAYS